MGRENIFVLQEDMLFENGGESSRSCLRSLFFCFNVKDDLKFE
jgi:hypothetical protein